MLLNLKRFRQVVFFRMGVITVFQKWGRKQVFATSGVQSLGWVLARGWVLLRRVRWGGCYFGGLGVSSASVAGCDDVLYPQCRLIHPRGRRFREVGAIRVLAA